MTAQELIECLYTLYPDEQQRRSAEVRLRLDPTSNTSGIWRLVKRDEVLEVEPETGETKL